MLTHQSFQTMVQNKLDEICYRLGFEHPTYRQRIAERQQNIRDWNKHDIMEGKLIPYFYDKFMLEAMEEADKQFNDNGINLFPVIDETEIRRQAKNAAECSFQAAINEGSLDDLYILQ